MGYNVSANNMREAEVKILDIKRGEVESKLRSLGAKKVFDGEIHALYYDDAAGSVGKRKGALRLRREGKKAVLTYKGHVGDLGAKVREETEVRVSSFDQTRWIIEALGFSVWLEMKKHRTSYSLQNGRFEFDKYGGEYGYIPEFLEIEGPDVGTVHVLAGLLGFSKKDCRPWDAVQLAKHYAPRRRRKGL
ncbi:MAG: class IV adenylate cyclase [Nitrospiraceae bacterium]|nr:class IV adenylate cyclase [Nitrospiraceae bacterium]